MKINGKKTAAVAVAAVMTCGLFAGCDLVISNNTKNMNQTIAEVDITDSDVFKSEFGQLDTTLVEKVIGVSSISKREMIVTFVGAGYSAMTSYGWTYKDTFDAISQSLIERQIIIQYAKAYFLKNGWYDEDNDTTITYNDLAAFNKAVQDENGAELKGVAYDVATLKYFLTKEEQDKADFATRVMFNNSIDSLEDGFIEKKEDDHDHESNVRTTPTGIDKTDADFYDTEYRVYTGTGKQNAVRGCYETKEGSTVTTRMRAYNELIASLESNDLIKRGEDTSNVETLDYYKIENKNDYEDALIKKLTDTFAKQAEAKLTQKEEEEPNYCENKFYEILSTQREKFAASPSALESAMDGISDTSFVLTATGNGNSEETKSENAFGFVINILLPFSAAQSDELSNEKQDFGDTKGNNFAARARLLQKIKATDQRGTWFSGETDYSFTAGEDAYKGTLANAEDRTYLFFEDYLNEETSKYERLSNYIGKYTYNGTWDAEARKYKPYAITIDQFIEEMEGYLSSVLEIGLEKAPFTKPRNYYDKPVSSYYKNDGSVDYEQFVYYENAISFDGGYNANNIFKKGSPENTAFSVINELSFAYNTDTAGLNSYLGYAVSANKTNFVSEFEYAAQKVVLAGAGSYIVAPSDYGWHIIYCTFSFRDTNYGASGDIKTPFKYEDDQKTEKGTFSYLFYESLKADAASSESSSRRTKITESYKDSYTRYEERYTDLSNLDKK